MAQFLTTHGVASEIERLIVGARERLVLVTPYLKVSQILIERLLDASRTGVAISLVYGKVELPDAEMVKLRRVSKLDLRFSEHLHAKCYFNESMMVLASMNLHEFSEKNNREFGVLLTANEQVYRDAVREVESILANAVAVGMKAQAVEPSRQRLTGTRREPRDFVVSHVGCRRLTCAAPDTARVARAPQSARVSAKVGLTGPNVRQR
jgi:phosphatidylserine/phosphatidylglycerophosphate/cardiolipin synthase-like enzyme